MMTSRVYKVAPGSRRGFGKRIAHRRERFASKVRCPYFINAPSLQHSLDQEAQTTLHFLPLPSLTLIMEDLSKTRLHPDVPPGTTLKYSTTLHPVQKIERDFAKIEKTTKRKLQAAAYGSALPMRMMMQEHMLSQCQRLPGLPSSYAGLDSLTGRDEKIDFEDFMDLPHESPEMPAEEPRDELERILRIRARSQSHE